MEQDRIQLIVEHNFNDNGAYEEFLSQFCIIKYRLPLIGVLAVELAADDLPRIYGADTRPIYNNAIITTQSKSKNNPVGIAILDTGVAPLDDFILPSNRLIAFVDIVNNRNEPYDDNAHGTHVAGIAAGNGYSSGGRFKGIAPEVNIIAVKVLDETGKGSTIDVLAGIEWVIQNMDEYNIRVANLSIGVKADSGDPLVKAVEAAWDAGIVMCAAAGNNGPDASTVTSPGVSKKVITVGACDDDMPRDMRVNFSGRGPTGDCIIKPDCLAPGADIISCLSNSAELSEERKTRLTQVFGNYTRMSGTSMSSPYVAGAIARLLQSKPELAPDDIKLLLKQSCRDINQSPNRQGWGLFDIKKFWEV
jgi:serine protease AprX